MSLLPFVCSNVLSKFNIYGMGLELRISFLWMLTLHYCIFVVICRLKGFDSRFQSQWKFRCFGVPGISQQPSSITGSVEMVISHKFCKFDKIPMSGASNLVDTIKRSWRELIVSQQLLTFWRLFIICRTFCGMSFNQSCSSQGKRCSNFWFWYSARLEIMSGTNIFP